MISIPEPCGRSWAAMDGDERRRFCGASGKFVYAAKACRRLVWVGAMLLAISPVFALDGRLRVQVTDPSGAAVAAGELTALCADRGTRKTPVANGNASFQDLPEGNCELTVTVPGFKPWTQSLVLRGGEQAEVAARLELAAAAEKVAVRPKSAGRRFVDWLTSCTRK